MTPKPSRFGFTPAEHRISALPSTAASVAVLGIIASTSSLSLAHAPARAVTLWIVCLLGIAYVCYFNWVIVPSPTYSGTHSWVNAGLSSLGISVLTFTGAVQDGVYLGVLLILTVIGSAIFSERGPAYFIVLATTASRLWALPGTLTDLSAGAVQLVTAVLACVIIETVMQLKKLSRAHIRRLETVTDFSRKITSTLDTRQVMALLNAAFQNAVEADTYFVGIREGNEMRLELVYDDGEYFENQRVGLEGSLSSWVISNHQSLFLPDLRKEVVLPGVRLVLLGKHKTSLSWMGVPMQNESLDGIIAIGSYRPNAFDRADLELLSSLAQHAAQALQNTHEHEEVELRSQLDSLTGVYNHGNFLRLLQKQADQAAAELQSLSLIMLDVDHFKQYNDSYGHLVGDEVLTTLCATIKQHIKSTDIVGRWGGEEFVISLPNTGADQAEQIALRVRDTMQTLTVRVADGGKTVPVPTVSQGLAVYPKEAVTIMDLIDLADRRLYVAKDRGRNQIEPEPSHWDAAVMQRRESETRP